MTLPPGLIRYGIIGSIVFGAGFVVGERWDAGAHAREMKQARENSIALIDRQIQERRVCEVERDQARAEVEKFNTTVKAQLEEFAALLVADTEARTEALARVDRAARQAASEAKAAGEKAAQAREVIQNVADQCARAGVPDDVVRLLNDIIAAP